MPLRESEMRSKVVKMLTPWHAVPIENGVGVGTPDVEYVGGWLELKSVDQPKNPDTAVRVPHFSMEQRLWLRQRNEAGGRADVLIKVGNWWILLRGDIAAEILGMVSLGALIDACIDAWAETPSGGALMEALKRDPR